MTNIGRREAYSRMAHVMCELLVRMRAVGLVEDHTCDLPITQGEFADAIGVSTVHVNRVLQQLRADGLIELKGSRLNIPDWEKLKQAGDFDPTYLHLEQDQGRMSLTLQPVRVANGSDEEGMLVFDGQQRLLGVLTHLGNQYDGLSGQWYLEAGFGSLEAGDPPTFTDLDAAQEWIRQRLAKER